MSSLISVNSSNFQSEVLDSTIPVLVDFSAVWCGPCQRMVPVLESVAKIHAGKVKVCKLDIDESEQLAAKYHIRSVPTLIVFSDGKIAFTRVGMIDQETLSAILQTDFSK